MQAETERRYLIEMPNEDFLSRLKRIDIVQTYLSSDRDESVRVRKCVTGNEAKYFFNIKKRLSYMTNLEEERLISEKEYDRMLLSADSSRKSILKTRYFYQWSGYTYEIDVYSFSVNRAVMEVELPSEDGIPPKVPEIKIIRELTGDNAFSNRAVALEIPLELTL